MKKERRKSLPDPLCRLFLGNGKNQGRKNVVWNMAGSILCALSTIVLMSAAGRTTGEDGGAVFTAAYTLAQQLLTIGYFEVRAFQVTDLHCTYAFEDYFTFRVITCAVMLLSGLGYAAATGGGSVKIAVVLLVCAYKMLDALSDVFEGEFQKDERLDLSGKSLTVRSLASMAAFCLVGYGSGNIVLASLAALVAAAFAVVIVDFGLIGNFACCRIRFHGACLRGIFSDCILLFVGSFFNLYLMNGAKYAGERYLSAAEYYAFTAAIFMPANVIQLVSSFLFRPALVTMMKHYEERHYRAFERLIGFLLAGIAGITAATLLGAAVLGIPVLELLYPIDLTGRRPEMLIVILGGGFYALSVILYYILTVMRRQKLLCFGYAVTAVVTAAVPYVLAGQYGMRGTAVGFLVLMAALALVLGTIALFAYRSDKRKGLQDL